MIAATGHSIFAHSRSSTSEVFGLFVIRFAYCDSVGKPSLETNLYLYTGDNPINRTDPLGLFWNGNAGGGYWPQDMVCSPPAQRFNNNRCTKNCCIKHDLCYQQYGCNSTSWYGHFPGPLPIPSICQLCNYEAAACIIMNRRKTDCDCTGGAW